FSGGAAGLGAVQEEEIGPFSLTDFLARQFDSIIWNGLGLDRHPELLPMYFASYTRLPSPAPRAAPRPPARAAADVFRVVKAARLSRAERRPRADGARPGRRRPARARLRAARDRVR